MAIMKYAYVTIFVSNYQKALNVKQKFDVLHITWFLKLL